MVLNKRGTKNTDHCNKRRNPLIIYRIFKKQKSNPLKLSTYRSGIFFCSIEGILRVVYQIRIILIFSIHIPTPSIEKIFFRFFYNVMNLFTCIHPFFWINSKNASARRD
ncbi:hypothetical protein CW304_21245 [Bacillus sp. UFRGS-B20]|nr:hypothetical protein CW304_21245 [Bacillus sp. UFRGS-B20]